MKFMRFITALVLILSCSRDDQIRKEKETEFVNQKANHLQNETSPYLLQHAYNPVEWYPWGDDAFTKAKQENKPILVSIGYAACHWCHVMEHESFEDESIAALMNELFVCIKVDREERPDVDQVYMHFVQITTGQGGWPLNVFLTPDRVPFFGGTYFPPDRRYGRRSWPEVLKMVSEYYRNQPDELKLNIAAVQEAFSTNTLADAENGLPDENDFNRAVQKLADSFDSENGGLGGAPKFPPVQPLQLFLRQYHISGDPKYLQMVELTLKKMARGGIYDQIGGGFARYSVDDKWLVPHFEKMLYDNAQLVPLLLDTYLLTKNEFYLDIARQTLEFAAREMLSPQGGFYSSLDADSEGEEGKFYVWHKKEIDQILGKHSGFFCEYFNITRNGNFEGKNIPNITEELSIIAQRHNLSVEEAEQIIRDSRQKLFEVRSARVRPGLDDKALTSWNALMLSAFARACQVTADPQYQKIIRKNIGFLFNNLVSGQSVLRTFNKGQAKYDGFLDDYAFLIQALLDSYEALFDPDLLDKAFALLSTANARFSDPQGSGYFYSSGQDSTLITRMKDEYDQSIPSGTGVMLLNNLRFYSLTADPALLKIVEQTFAAYRSAMQRSPYGFGSFLTALDFYLRKPFEIVLLAQEQKQLQPYNQFIYQRYLPNKLLINITGGNQPSALTSGALSGKQVEPGKTAAYVCRDFSCSLPVTSLQDLAKLLE